MQRRGRRRCRERTNETNERRESFFLEGGLVDFSTFSFSYMEKVVGPVVLHWLSNHRPAVNVFFSSGSTSAVVAVLVVASHSEFLLHCNHRE
jgi:hypothetical protein